MALVVVMVAVAAAVSVTKAAAAILKVKLIVKVELLVVVVVAEVISEVEVMMTAARWCNSSTSGGGALVLETIGISVIIIAAVTKVVVYYSYFPFNDQKPCLSGGRRTKTSVCYTKTTHASGTKSHMDKDYCQCTVRCSIHVIHP